MQRMRRTQKREDAEPPIPRRRAKAMPPFSLGGEPVADTDWSMGAMGRRHQPLGSRRGSFSLARFFSP